MPLGFPLSIYYTMNRISSLIEFLNSFLEKGSKNECVRVRFFFRIVERHDDGEIVASLEILHFPSRQVVRPESEFRAAFREVLACPSVAVDGTREKDAHIRILISQMPAVGLGQCASVRR